MQGGCACCALAVRLLAGAVRAQMGAGIAPAAKGGGLAPARGGKKGGVRLLW
jgi:hypothetical protein